MNTIKHRQGLSALRRAGRHPPALLDLIESRMRDVTIAYAETGWEWDPEEHGAFAILEEGDGAAEYESVALNAEEGLLGACWEACYAHTGPERAYEVLHLFSNDGGWTIFVPMDAGWLTPALLAKLQGEATEPPSDTLPGSSNVAPF